MNVLFVCNGNVFRSMAAEYSLNRYVKEHGIKGLSASSAGLLGGKYTVFEVTRQAVEELGLDISGHIPRPLSKELLNKQDLVIVMAGNQQEHIKENYKIQSVFFNELVNGRKEPIPDVDEVIPGWTHKSKEGDDYIKQTINYINQSIPALVQNLLKRI